METNQKTELENETWAIMEIFLNAYESFKIVEFLQSNESDNNTAYVKRMNSFFQYSKILCWRNTATELSKLLSNRNTDQYNLRGFLKKIKEGKFPESTISAEQISKWEQILDRENEVINNILEQRDKVYAHTDRESDKVINKVSITKTTELLDYVFDIIHKIYLDCFKKGIIKETIGSPLNALKWTVDELVKEDKRLEKLEQSL